ncbi:orn_DAP_Arg_deC domain-containing protein [Trichonephila clavipes]|nr:orn_DAP_Arg_deC domain-containing protein [Trichonephila clavipes]
MQTVLIGGVPEILGRVPSMARGPLVRHPGPRECHKCSTRCCVYKGETSSEIEKRPKYKSKVWGQTCCCEDVILEECLLPDMEEGQFILWKNMGAYIRGVASKFTLVPYPANRYIFIQNPSDEAHFWLNGYVNKQNYRIWSEANPQVYVETPLHPEKLTVWCALWAGGILQKR